MAEFYAAGDISEESHANVSNADGTLTGTVDLPPGKTFGDYPKDENGNYDLNGEGVFTPAGDGDGQGGDENPDADSELPPDGDEGDENPGEDDDPENENPDGDDPDGEGSVAGDDDEALGRYLEALDAYNQALEDYESALEEADGLADEIEALSDEAEGLGDEAEDLQSDLENMQDNADDISWSSIGEAVSNAGDAIQNINDTNSSLQDLSDSMDSPRSGIGSGANQQVQDPTRGVAVEAEPVGLFSGAFYCDHNDISISSLGFNLDVTRHYTNQVYSKGSFGYKWDVWFDASVRELSDGTLYYWQGCGRGYFILIDAASGNYITPDGLFETYKKVSSGFEITDRYGDVRKFNRNGKLEKLSDRFGNFLKLTRDINEKVLKIEDRNGRSITLSYNVSGFVESITDFTNRKWIYSYNTSQELVSVQHPIGRTVRYDYTAGSDPRAAHNLESISDTAGNKIVENEFGTAGISFNRVTTQRFTSDPYAFNYDLLRDDVDPEPANKDIVTQKTTLIDPRGIRSEYSFNVFGNLLEEKVYTNGIRPGDPAQWVIGYAYDDIGNNIGINYADGIGVEFEYDSGNRDISARGNVLSTAIRSNDGSPRRVMSEFTFGSYNQVSKIEIPGGGVIRYALDSLGRVSKIDYPHATNALGVSQQPSALFTYNSDGLITSFTDAEGHLFEYTYGRGIRRGLLSSWSLGGVKKETYEYDDLWRITSNINPKNQRCVIGYNAADQYVFEQSPASFQIEKRYEYDTEGRLIREKEHNVDENGVVGNPAWIDTVMSYDLRGRMINLRRHLDPGSFTDTKMEWDGNGNLVKLIDAEGKEFIYGYDERDLLYRRTLLPGTVDETTETHTYNGLQKLALYRDPMGNVYSNEFDGYGRVIKSKDPMNNTVECEWNNLDQLKARRKRDKNNILLAETLYNHDGLGRIYETIESIINKAGTNIGSLSNKIIFDLIGRPCGIINMDGDVYYNKFDDEGMVIEAGDPMGNKVKYNRDSLGLVEQAINICVDTANPGVTSIFMSKYKYDQIGRILSGEDGLGNKTTLKWDSRSHIRSVTRPDGIEQQFSFDLGDRLKGISIPWISEDGSNLGTYTEHHTYDSLDRRIASQDALGNITRFNYDKLGFFTYSELPDGTHQYNFERDSNGNVMASTDANGNFIEYKYDKLNRLIRLDVTQAAGTEGLTFEKYSYDGLHNLIESLNDNHGFKAIYDSLGRIHEESVDNVVTGYEFKSNGLLDAVNYPGGMKLNYELDKNSRLRQITLNTTGAAFPGSLSAGSVLAKFDYLGGLMPSKMELANGNKQQIIYDACGRPIESVWRDRAGNILEQLIMLRDELGRSQFEQRSNIQAVRFGYDSTGRLSSVTGGPPVGVISYSNWLPSSSEANPAPVSKQTNLNSYATTQGTHIVTNREDIYTYDKNGNRITVKRKYNTIQNQDTYTVNGLSQYTSVNGIPIVYDNNGNIMSDGKYSYIYDFRNRVIRIEDIVSNTLVYSVEYDTAGRVAKLVSLGKTKILRYTGPDVIEEIDQVSGKEKWSVAGMGADQPIVSFSESGEKYSFTNPVQTVVSISDESGVVTHYILQDEFGRLLRVMDAQQNDVSPTEVLGINRFQGRPVVDENELHDFRKRLYDSRIGRFIQRDPLLSAGTLNPYTFVYNNPGLFTDPTGEIPIILIGVAVGALVGGGVAAFMNRDKSGADFLVAVGAGVASGAIMGTGYGLTSMVAGGAVGGVISGGYEGGKVGGYQGALVGGAFGGAFGAAGGALGGAVGNKASTAITGRLTTTLISRGFAETNSHIVSAYVGTGLGGMANGSINGGVGGFGNGVGQGLASNQSVEDSLRMGGGNILPGMVYGGLYGGAFAVGGKASMQGLIYTGSKSLNGILGNEAEWFVQNEARQAINQQNTKSTYSTPEGKVPDFWGRLKADVKNTQSIPSLNKQPSPKTVNPATGKTVAGKGQLKSFIDATPANETFTIYHRPGIALPTSKSLLMKYVAANNKSLAFKEIPQKTMVAPVSRDWYC